MFGVVNDVWNSIITRSWGSKLNFLSSVPDDDEIFDLVFGSCLVTELPWVSQILPNLPMAISLLDDFQASSLPVGFTSLVIKHATTGGVTDAASTFLFRQLGTVSVPRSVPQPLASIVDYKNFVGPLKNGPHLDIHADLLPVNNLRALVQLPRSFGSNQLGSRSFTFSELFSAWNIPRSSIPQGIKPEIWWFTTLIPCNLILAVSDAVCSKLNLTSIPLGLPKLPPLPSRAEDPKGTFLPELGRYLSRDWIDPALITDVARKADNAAVPVSLWNFRTCQPLGVDHNSPTIQRRLDILRRLFLDRLKLTAIRDFQHYMSSKHSVVWKHWKSFYLHQVYYPWLFVDSIKQLRGCRHSWGFWSLEPDWLKPVSSTRCNGLCEKLKIRHSVFCRCTPPFFQRHFSTPFKKGTICL